MRRLVMILAVLSCSAGSARAARICATSATVEGIDVSRWQSTVNWAQVKAAGKVFAIASVGHGLYEDVQFDANWRGMKAAGLIRGAYQFFSPGDDATVQAEIMIRRVGRLEPDDLPVVLDVEETDGLPAATIAAKVRTWITRVEAATGKPVTIYTGKYFWNDNVQTADFADKPLWIPAYNVACPDTPTVWSGWHMWQYSSTGSVGGITGNVDLDRFNGTEAELRAFARGGRPWGASFVAQSFPLARTALRMTAGERLPAWIELRNTGTQAWTMSTMLATTEPRDRSSRFADATWAGPDRPAGVLGSVAPGATYRFAFVLVAPQQPGIYHEHFGVVQEGVAWFSDPAQGGPPDGQLEAQIEVVAAPVVVPVDQPVMPGDTEVTPAPAPAGEVGAQPGGCNMAAGASGGAGLVLLAAMLLLALARQCVGAGRAIARLGQAARRKRSV